MNSTGPSKRTRRTLAVLGKELDPDFPVAQNDQKAPCARVTGPYYDANVHAYRLVVFDGTKRKSVRAASEADALRLKAELEQTLQQTDRTVATAIEEFVADMRLRGLNRSTLITLSYKLKYFLPQEQSIVHFSARQARNVYEAETVRNTRRGPTRAQTHHTALRIAKRFFRWAVEKRYIGQNPFEGVRPIGKAHKGKEQLRIDESRRMTDLLVNEGRGGVLVATALLTQLLLGLRNGEVLPRTVRDLDDAGRVLWIPTGKTENARRRLDVPEVLRPLLLALAKDQPADALLFPGKNGQPHYQSWLYRNLRHYCIKAGLQQVCPHSLRGLHSTLAVAAGCTSGAVAAALGHGSFEVTKKHYVDADTLCNTASRRVADTLTPSSDASGLIDKVLALPPDELAALRRALNGKKAA